jgi:hypothetical protein
MRIEINKNQQELNFRKHVQNIIYMASDCAKRGIKEFKYTTPIDIGRSSEELFKSVEFETEGTVMSLASVQNRFAIDGKMYFEIK